MLTLFLLLVCYDILKFMLCGVLPFLESFPQSLNLLLQVLVVLLQHRLQVPCVLDFTVPFVKDWYPWDNEVSSC